MKKILLFIIGLALLSFSLGFKNAGVIALMQTRFGSKDFIDLVEKSLQFFDFITWLIFITISIPVNVNKLSKVISALFFILYAIAIVLNVQHFDTKVFVGLVAGVIAVLIYYKMVNRYNFAKKMKDGIITAMDPNKIIFQSAWYTFIFSCVFTISVMASVFSLSFLVDAPVWTILVILPLAELLVWGMLIAIFKSFGDYVIDRLNVHPAIVRSLYAYTVFSIVIIALFYLTALPTLFSSGNGFFRGLTNLFIVLFALRVFTVSLTQFQNHITRAFQTAFAKKKNEYTFNEVNYPIEEQIFHPSQPINSDEIACPRCLGKGHVDDSDIVRLNRTEHWGPGGPCAYCEGAGKVDSELLTWVDPDDAHLTTALSPEERERYRSEKWLKTISLPIFEPHPLESGIKTIEDLVHINYEIVPLDSLIDSFSLIERLELINEMFEGSNDVFSSSIKLLDEQSNLSETRPILAEMAEMHNWDLESETTKKFILKICRRYVIGTSN
jgi:hypothetical protein